MGKYIDTEKLIALIDTKLEDLGMSGSVWVGRSVLRELKDEIMNILQQEQQEVDKYDCPTTPIEEAIEVTSRMQYIDEEMKPIAKFIMDYASWNLHKDEWNQPVIEVPLFRVLDALVQRGKPYCNAG